jgi:DNA mismatch repair protein MutL
MALAQYRESYIVAQDREGLLLVDQHAAHERVIFERYLEQAESNAVERQSLLFPITVELSTEEAIVAEEELPELRRLGLDLEPFGERTMRVDAVPALAGEVDAAVLLKELIGEAAQTRSAASGVGTLRHRLVTSAACQAAIKVNYPLTRPAMQGLLDDLFATVNPTTCPHGRPALFRLTLDEIERAFRRR